VEVEVGSEKRTGIKFKVVAKSTGEAVEEKEAEVNNVNKEQ
jgi:hypothetical protein